MFNFYLIAGLLIALVTGAIAHYIDISFLEANYKHQLEDQRFSLISECEKNKKTTEEANEYLTKQNTSIAARLTTLRLHKPSTCVPVTNSTNTADSGNRHATTNISSDWLLEYGAECETYRTQRIALEKFINDERK